MNVTSPNANSYDDLPLDHLGAQAHGHIVAGDRAKEKAEQQYLAAGLYLAAAKRRVERTKGLTWPAYLIEHCPIGRRRADEIIMIADGRKTVEEVREKKNETSKAAHRKTREAAKAHKSALNSAQSFEKAQQNQQRSTPDTAAARAEALVQEARDTTSDPRLKVIERINVLMRLLTLDDLNNLEAILNSEVTSRAMPMAT